MFLNKLVGAKLQRGFLPERTANESITRKRSIKTPDLNYKRSAQERISDQSNSFHQKDRASADEKGFAYCPLGSALRAVAVDRLSLSHRLRHQPPGMVRVAVLPRRGR